MGNHVRMYVCASACACSRLVHRAYNILHHLTYSYVTVGGTLRADMHECARAGTVGNRFILVHNALQPHGAMLPLANTMASDREHCAQEVCCGHILHVWRMRGSHQTTFGAKYTGWPRANRSETNDSETHNSFCGVPVAMARPMSASAPCLHTAARAETALPCCRQVSHMGDHVI